MLHRTAAFILEAASRLLRLLVAAARRAWRSHRRLLRENAAYALAIAAGAAAIVGQDSAADLIATITAAVLAVHAAITRGVAPR